MSDKKVKVEFEGKVWECPVIEGSEKEKAFDIGKLRDQSGFVTMDNGFANTSTCKSAITFLDGEKGVLHYRGIPIEQLAEKSSFMEVAYLLIYGHLPTEDEFEKFKFEVHSRMIVREDVKRVYEGFPYDGHPMAMLMSAVCAMSAYYNEELDPHNKEHVEKNIWRLLGQFPTLVAYAYRHTRGEAKLYPESDKEYCENFLKLMFSSPSDDFEAPKEWIEAMNLLLILHADHEQNCSTSTVRMVGSSDANLFASISAGIGALWGPLHGGANQAVMEMLEQIHKNGGDVNKYVGFAKDKNSSFRLMGFGHRVYKNFDPRASIIKKTCDKVLSKLGIHNPLLDIAKKLEEVALKDSYFKEKKLYPNVDFYSGIIYSALNIPVEMFTPMFALGRLPGWIAHWKEMHDSGIAKIGRPRQIYTGPTKSEYVPIKERKKDWKKAA